MVEEDLDFETRVGLASNKVSFQKIFYFEDTCVKIAEKEMRTPESVVKNIRSRLRGLRPRFFRKR